jgi:hypothetical protein
LQPKLLPAKSKDSTRVLRRNEEANATTSAWLRLLFPSSNVIFDRVPIE